MKQKITISSSHYKRAKAAQVRNRIGQCVSILTFIAFAMIINWSLNDAAAKRALTLQPSPALPIVIGDAPEAIDSFDFQGYEKPQEIKAQPLKAKKVPKPKRKPVYANYGDGYNIAFRTGMTHLIENN